MNQVHKSAVATLFSVGLLFGGASALVAGAVAPVHPAAMDTVVVRTEPVAAPAGTLFIVGGGPQPTELVQRFVDLAGGKGKARIVVFGMAGTARGGEGKAAELRGYGVDAVSLHIDRQQADTDSIVRFLDGVTGVWFIGGQQTRLARALVGTRVADRIRELYQGGAVIGGTSAGAAIMSTPMITGGEKRLGGARPPRDSTERYLTIDRENVMTGTGLSLIQNTIIDQHFLRRKRQNRLVSLVLEHPQYVGVGIDESTAVIVHPNGSWSVLGESVAVVYDARRSQVTPAGAPALGATGMVVHVIPSGGTFDPATGRATLPGKQAN